MSGHGDSGGPIFIDGAIAGVNAFSAWLPVADFTGKFDGSWGEVSFNTRVSSLREFIFEATDGEVLFVPEPSSIWSVFFAGVVFTRRINWRR